MRPESNANKPITARIVRATGQRGSNRGVWAGSFMTIDLSLLHHRFRRFAQSVFQVTASLRVVRYLKEHNRLDVYCRAMILRISDLVTLLSFLV